MRRELTELEAQIKDLHERHRRVSITRNRVHSPPISIRNCRLHFYTRIPTSRCTPSLCSRSCFILKPGAYSTDFCKSLPHMAGFGLVDTWITKLHILAWHRFLSIFSQNPT